MKILARIAAAITAVLVSLFVATPALAHEGESHDLADQFSSAGQPVDVDSGERAGEQRLVREPAQLVAVGADA